jgi:sRNA-binding carbon storage regulator CsrA
MLVLKRKKSTAIVTNSGVRVEVVEVSTDKAFLLIQWNGGHLSLWASLYQMITIDGHLEIAVASTEAGACRLGINAPRNVEIMREELLENPATALSGTLWAGK